MDKLIPDAIFCRFSLSTNIAKDNAINSVNTIITKPMTVVRIAFKVLIPCIYFITKKKIKLEMIVFKSGIPK